MGRLVFYLFLVVASGSATTQRSNLISSHTSPIRHSNRNSRAAFATCYSPILTQLPKVNQCCSKCVLPSSIRFSTRLNSFFDSSLAGIENFYETAPYTAAFVTCGLKASAADLVAQIRQFESPASSSTTFNRDDEEDITDETRSKMQGWVDEVGGLTQEGSSPVELQRNMAFILYGGFYQGCAQEYIYNHCFPSMFGSATSFLPVVSKVVFDMVVLTPLLCLPIAYLTKAFIFRYSFLEGLNGYIDDVRNHGLLKTYWSLWAPVQVCTFSIVPEHFRIAFIACVSFFWLIILSTISSREDVH